MRQLALAVALAVVAGCGGGAETAEVALEGAAETTTVTVEIADSPEERRRGLAGRENLAAEAGMLFLFDEPATSGFWMKDTLIPLAIAFVGPDERIVAIREMTPCRREPCPVYRAGRPFSAALEVNGGAFSRWGVGVGDRVRVER